MKFRILLTLCLFLTSLAVNLEWKRVIHHWSESDFRQLQSEADNDLLLLCVKPDTLEYIDFQEKLLAMFKNDVKDLHVGWIDLSTSLCQEEKRPSIRLYEKGQVIRPIAAYSSDSYSVFNSITYTILVNDLAEKNGLLPSAPHWKKILRTFKNVAFRICSGILPSSKPSILSGNVKSLFQRPLRITARNAIETISRKENVGIYFGAQSAQNFLNTRFVVDYFQDVDFYFCDDPSVMESLNAKEETFVLFSQMGEKRETYKESNNWEMRKMESFIRSTQAFSRMILGPFFPEKSDDWESKGETFILRVTPSTAALLTVFKIVAEKLRSKLRILIEEGSKGSPYVQIGEANTDLNFIYYGTGEAFNADGLKGLHQTDFVYFGDFTAKSLQSFVDDYYLQKKLISKDFICKDLLVATDVPIHANQLNDSL